MTDYDSIFAGAMRATLGDKAAPASAPAASAPSTSDPYDSVFDAAMKKTLGDKLPASAAPSTSSEVPSDQRSLLEELGRQVGLTVRAGTQGAAAIPAMMSDAVTGPINAGLDKVLGKDHGFRFMRASDALGNVMTAAGVPKPETATERVVQDAASAVAGAGSFSAAGKVLANAASPVASAVGEQLAAGPVLQMTSAATGAGAAGATRELGGSPGAQIAAGVVGAMLPGAIGALKPTKGSAQIAEAAKKANEVGYVIPPADLNPGPVAEVLSGVGGKVKTAQSASARNQTVTNALAKKALGIAEDQPLDLGALSSLRGDAAKAYESVSGAGTITPSSGYAAALDDAIKPYLSQAKSFPSRKMPSVVEDIKSLKTPSFDAGDAVQTIKVIRSEADTAYRTGDKMAGKALRQAASAIENEIEQHLVNAGAPAADVLNAYRDARQLIAKTYSIEKALNPQTGNIDAQQLARDLKKGAPLSGDLRTIAEFAQAFPKAAQALKEAPKELSPLDMMGGAAALASGHPAIAGLAVGRPIARTVSLSDFAQNRAIRTAGVNSSSLEGLPASAVEAASRTGQTTDDAPPEELPVPTNGPVPAAPALAPVPPSPQQFQPSPQGVPVSVAPSVNPEFTPPITPVKTSEASGLVSLAQAKTVDDAIHAAQMSLASALDDHTTRMDARLIPVSQRNVSPEAQNIDTSAAPVAKAAEIEQVAPAVSNDGIVASAQGVSVPAQPAPIVQAVAAPVAGDASVAQPASIWTGRRGAGYLREEDAIAALPSRQRNERSLDWRVEQVQGGRFRLAGYEKADEATNAPVAISGDATPNDPSTGAFNASVQPDGALLVRGDMGAVKSLLDHVGLHHTVGQDGIVVGQNHSQIALELLSKLSEQQKATA